MNEYENNNMSQQNGYVPQQNGYVPQQNGYVPQPNDGKVPGKGAATGSLVCGIIAIVFYFFGPGSLVSLILGIVGLILAGKSKKAGFTGGLRTAGFVLSLLGVIFGAIIFVGCVACAGGLAALGASGGLNDFSYVFR